MKFQDQRFVKQTWQEEASIIYSKGYDQIFTDVAIFLPFYLTSFKVDSNLKNLIRKIWPRPQRKLRMLYAYIPSQKFNTTRISKLRDMTKI